MRLAPVLTLMLLSVVLVPASTASAAAERPADALLKLVPADAGLTLTLEDLRGQFRTILASPLAERLRGLPEFERWKQSESFRGVQAAIARVETLLGEKLSTVGNELFGDAVVLTLQMPADRGPDAARGMLVMRVPNRALLDRLIEGLNKALTASGELQSVARRQRAGVTYHVREFRPGARLPEYYAVLDGSVFAWSNSEELITGAIDRGTGGSGGLADLAAFRQVRASLPREAAASLFIDPRVVERVLASTPRAKTPEEDLPFALITRLLGDTIYAGAALEWRDGVVLHIHGTVDPSKVLPALKRLAAQPNPFGESHLRVPETTLAVATGTVDLGIALDLLQGLTSERNRPKLDNLVQAFNGILLGHDLRAQVLPSLGPGYLIAVDGPELDAVDGPLPDAAARVSRVPAALVLPITKAPPSDAIDNALRTLLAFYALDEKHEGGRLRVVSRTVAGAKVTSLGERSPFAYAIHGGNLVLGTSTETVARALAAQGDASSGARFRAIRAACFPGQTSFVCVDLKAVHAYADRNRPVLARRLASRQGRPEAEVARDLDQGLGLISLFDAAFFATTVAPEFTSVHHTLGIVALPGDGAKR